LGIDLSIVIVSWNTRDVLLPAVASVFREVKEVSYEVLVVDNGSKDGSADAVEAEFPGANVIRIPRNLGFAGGNNVALRRAQGRYAVLLNSDTITRAGAFERMVRYMDEHPEVGACGPQLLKPDGSKQNCFHNFPSLATELVNLSLLKILFPRKYPSKRETYTEPIEVDAVLGACMMVRREVIEKVGLMDERFFLFLEETDWCVRIREAGWKVVHIPDARITHLSGESSKKKRPAQTWIEYYRSLYRFFAKNRGKGQKAIVVAFRFMKICVDLVFTSALVAGSLGSSLGSRRRLSAYATLLAWHLRGCPAQWGLGTPVGEEDVVAER
jgi:GT2 family glycosyltransferase